MAKTGKYQILDFGVWRYVKKGVIVNNNWLKWQHGVDTGVARPGAWKEIPDMECKPSESGSALLVGYHGVGYGRL